MRPSPKHNGKAAPLTMIGAMLFLTGCFGGGWRIGYRTAVTELEAGEEEEERTGIYSGPKADLAIYQPDRPKDERAVYVGLKWAYVFAGGRKYNFHTVEPVVGYFRNGWKGDELEHGVLPSLGGFAGTGIDIQKRKIGFHASLCGGSFSTLEVYACTRYSTRGFIGFDANIAVAAPVPVEEVDDLFNSGALAGLGYLLM